MSAPVRLPVREHLLRKPRRDLLAKVQPEIRANWRSRSRTFPPGFWSRCT
jgi:hypothetical protein